MNKPNVKQALKYLWIGTFCTLAAQLAAIVSNLLWGLFDLLPYAGWLLTLTKVIAAPFNFVSQLGGIAALVLEILALFIAEKDPEGSGYREALKFVLIAIVLSILASVFGSFYIVTNLFSIGSSVVSFLALTKIVNTTENVTVADDATAKLGSQALQFTLICVIVGFVFAIVKWFTPDLMDHLAGLVLAGFTAYTTYILFRFYQESEKLV